MCDEQFRYAVLTNQSPPTPFFYSTGGRSILLRRSDDKLAEQAMASDNKGLDQLHELWLEMLATAPTAPDGGAFELWANVRCPRCAYEFPYNKGSNNIAVRLYEAKIIVVDGSTIVGDSDADSYVIDVAIRS